MTILREFFRRKRSEHMTLNIMGNDGFTLIELLVVLGILALLAGVVAPQVLRYLGIARSDTAKTQINRIASAVELYFLDVGAYPTQSAGLKALVERPAQADRWNGPYLKKEEALFDPWGRPYIYTIPASKGDFGISTLGRDGQVGGSGEDSDLAN